MHVLCINVDVLKLKIRLKDYYESTKKKLDAWLDEITRCERQQLHDSNCRNEVLNIETVDIFCDCHEEHIMSP